EPAEAHHRQQYLGGDRERGKFERAEMTDDRGVDQQVERFGHEASERRDRQGDDPAVESLRAGHDGAVLRLRLFHAADGARIAYREGGTGRPLVLWHSAGLSHREFRPAAGELLDRMRVVLPDLPLHGDSEDGAAFPYEVDWAARLIAECTRDVGGARPRVGGSGVGGQLVLRAVQRGWLEPSRLVLLPGHLHRPPPARIGRSVARIAARAAAPAGPLAARAVVRAAVRPELAGRGSLTPGTDALVDGSRRALVEAADRTAAWRKLIAVWEPGEFRDLIGAYASVDCPTLVLWGADTPATPRRAADEAADLIDDVLLRELSSTGPLLAHEDPVGFARELTAFLRG
ncbi:MAG: alpha/beta hydrolase, partial [Gammaproteobacteria bacterium]|nr:alpha/beta hydrolase [Gammaproteobacteria bacterium]